MPKAKPSERGWCAHCGAASYGSMLTDAEMKVPRWWGCDNCGTPLQPLAVITDDEKAMVAMQDWFADVSRHGLNGPSPQDAAEELGCHRSMIDRLVGMKILEKSEFSFKGQKVIIISARSLAVAKENRKKTGNWTGHAVRRGA